MVISYFKCNCFLELPSFFLPITTHYIDALNLKLQSSMYSHKKNQDQKERKAAPTLHVHIALINLDGFITWIMHDKVIRCNSAVFNPIHISTFFIGFNN